MSETDLFGNPVRVASLPIQKSAGKRKPTVPKGYAAPPGSGPSGETCATCLHYARIEYAKVYLKCKLMRHAWTHGPGSDIRGRSPACRKWEKQTT